MKRLLLDTEAFIRWDADDARLGARTRTLGQRAAEVYVSAASAWEIANCRRIVGIRLTGCSSRPRAWKD